MSKSRFVFDKFAKLLEQGLVNYKDLTDEILNILKSKRDEIIFKMKLVSKEEVDILNKRISKLENQVNEIKKIKSKRKTKQAKRS
jgi:BMFP domain-containing protein YqiC